ncbi:NnrU family protein [Epibacterium ulvae]|uniref:NnrU family protein n=1 Tax=Epibacterium ulvae TaxID=1156985 RepID=UPI001BFCA8B7|nr:NnrU family protein [Epibacterium ulvae]MBT8154851.1 NnrU family protein [Epibacterium ulvae]
MALLVLGILLWWAAHLFKRLAPAKRAALGEKGKGPIALALFASIILMIWGYKTADVYDLAAPNAALKGINNLLVLVAFYMMSPAPKKGALLNGLRHPMLMGLGLWAVAHLLVNWDVASFALFGSMLVWTVVEIKVINRAEQEWTPGPKGTLAKDAMFFGASIVLVGAVGYVHGLVGPSPFGG